jgi:transposase
MSRKIKFSNNWKKAKTKIQRIHSHITNARKDFLHKASCQISQNPAMIAIEDLQIGNMSKSFSRRFPPERRKNFLPLGRGGCQNSRPFLPLVEPMAVCLESLVTIC